MVDMPAFDGPAAVQASHNGARLRPLIACVVLCCFGLVAAPTPHSALVELTKSTDVHFVGGPFDCALVAAPLLALIIWHFAPVRSWPILLLIGTVGPLGSSIATLSSRQADPSYLISLIAAVAAACIPVGIIGAGVWLWQVGSRNVGIALIGTVAAMQLAVPGIFDSSCVIPAAAVGLVGAVGALVITRKPGVLDSSPSVPRPPWRLSVVAGVAALTEVIPYLWLPSSGKTKSADYDSFAYLGLLLLAIGIIAALLCGVRVLVAAFALAFVSFPFLTLLGLVGPFAHGGDAMSVPSPFLLVGCCFVIGLSGWRHRIAITGLILLLPIFAGLAAIVFDLESDGAAVVGLLVFTLLAMVVLGASMSSIGAVLAERAEAVPVIVGLVVPIINGLLALNISITHSSGSSPNFIFTILMQIVLPIGGIVLVRRLNSPGRKDDSLSATTS